jgi:hypothetical protein
MNIWNVTGEVLRYGVKGKMYPKLWIHLNIPSPPSSGLTDNKLFVNFDLDTNLQSPNGKIGEFIQRKLKDVRYAFLSELMVTKIKTSKKDAEGNWINEDIVGVKGRLRNIKLFDSIPTVLNSGFVSGNVSKYHYNESSKQEKLIVGDRYRNPKTNEWGTRDVPVLYNYFESDTTTNLTSKSVFIDGALCGTSLDGQSKTYIWAKKKIILSQ